MSEDKITESDVYVSRETNGDAADDGAITKKIKESAKEIWLAGLGAFAKDEEESKGVFNTLVEEGKNIEAVTKRHFDKQINTVKEVALGKVDEIKERAVDSLTRLEHAFDERVSNTLSRLNIPTKQDIEALQKRVEKLEKTEKLKVSKPKASKPNSAKKKSAAASKATAKKGAGTIKKPTKKS